MIKFAMKNILRYRSRSILTMIVVAVSAFATVTGVGMMAGIMKHLLNGFIQYETAHIRFTTPEYNKKERFRPIHENISDVDNLKTELLQYSEIQLAIPTFHFNGLIEAGERVIPIDIISFDLEDNGFNLASKIIQGSLGNKGVLIGSMLKEKLSLLLGNSPLIISTTTESSLNAVKIPIIGITHFGISRFDKYTAIIDLETSQKLLRAPNATTEVFITLYNEKKTDEMTKLLQKKYPNYIVESYKTQMGSLYSTMQMEQSVLYWIAVLIMFFGSFVITNSLIANIYERMNEIGMLKALGYTNKELSIMLFYEGIIFGVIGGGLGFIGGYALVYHLSLVGIDFSQGLGDAGIPVETIIYPIMTFSTTILSLIISILIPGFVSLIPARILRNITPIEALSSR